MKTQSGKYEKHRVIWKTRGYQKYGEHGVENMKNTESYGKHGVCLKSLHDIKRCCSANITVNKYNHVMCCNIYEVLVQFLPWMW